MITFFINLDQNTIKPMKKHIASVYGPKSAFSDLFHAIAEQIANHTNWILGENFAEILNFIDNEDQKQIITIDNIFTVFFKSSCLD